MRMMATTGDVAVEMVVEWQSNQGAHRQSTFEW